MLRQGAPVFQQAQHLLHDFIQVGGWIKGLGMFGNMHLIGFTIFDLAITLIQMISFIPLT